MSKIDSIISLSKKLIEIKSTSNNRTELEKILNLALSHLQGFTIERFNQNGFSSVLVYNSPKRPKKFKILLNGHLDIIPGKDFQYIPQIKRNRLYGAGSMDMKANLASAIMAYKDVAKKVNYPLGIQLVTDEEIGGINGTKYQVDQGVRADFVIACEPTNFDIVNRTKGVLTLKISALGKSAHSAYPWLGDNAISKINEFICALKKKFQNPTEDKWVNTVNLCKIETTNIAFNKIPDNCAIYVDIRYIPEDEKKIINKIKKLIPRNFKFEILSFELPTYTNKNNKYIKSLQKYSNNILKNNIMIRGANGSSDARHFASVNCASIEFGPIGKGMGSDKEWVDIPSLEKYYDIIKIFLNEQYLYQ